MTEKIFLVKKEILPEHLWYKGPIYHEICELSKEEIEDWKAHCKKQIMIHGATQSRFYNDILKKLEKITTKQEI